MKKSIVMGVLVAGLMAGSLVVGSSSDVFACGHEGKGDRMERRLDRMTEKLDLTEDQQTKIKAIFEEKKAKMMQIREETNQEIQAVLTPEQKEKFQKHHEKRKEWK